MRTLKRPPAPRWEVRAGNPHRPRRPSPAAETSAAAERAADSVDDPLPQAGRLAEMVERFRV